DRRVAPAGGRSPKFSLRGRVLPESRSEAAMTDDKLKELEALTSVEPDTDGKVRVRAGDLRQLVSELRELRQHAADLSAHQGVVPSLHRLLTNLSAYGDPSEEVDTVSARIKIQDPGRCGLCESALTHV